MRDSKGGILAQKEKVISQAKSTFTSEIYDTYELCFISRVPPGKNTLPLLGFCGRRRRCLHTTSLHSYFIVFVFCRGAPVHPRNLSDYQEGRRSQELRWRKYKPCIMIFHVSYIVRTIEHMNIFFIFVDNVILWHESVFSFDANCSLLIRGIVSW